MRHLYIEMCIRDRDISINQIRKRPVAEEAKALGVTMTAEMKLDALPQDPHRDPVSYTHLLIVILAYIPCEEVAQISDY